MNYKDFILGVLFGFGLGFWTGTAFLTKVVNMIGKAINDIVDKMVKTL